MTLSVSRMNVFGRQFQQTLQGKIHGLMKRQEFQLNNAKKIQRSFATTTSNMYATKAGVVLGERLKEVDSEIQNLIDKEAKRQQDSIVLIPSENFTSKAVMDALGSIMQNKYSEGYPGQRYYGGNEYIDEVERLCQRRALELFNLDSEKWGVNVQPLSGSPANLEVYGAILKPHERLMGLDLPHGGHLSHGYQTPTKKISAVSTYFETFPYRVNEKTGLVDYEKLEENALLYRPKLIVSGASAYARNWDYKKLKEISDKVGSYLMFDMAHISGLIAANVLPDSPFNYADIVTTTTHKSLRGPRGAMIFYRKGIRSTNKKGENTYYNLEENINFSVFPGHQGGPHNHTITALAVALKQASTQEFKDYQKQVLLNAKTFENTFKELGYKLVSEGTDTHLLLIDLKNKGIDGARVERILELVNIATNKNTVPGDKSALIPGGLRIGTPAMTTRNLKEKDFKIISGFIDEAIKIAIEFKKEYPEQGKKLKDYKSLVDESLTNDNNVLGAKIKDLKTKVIEFSQQFPSVAI